MRRVIHSFFFGRTKSSTSGWLLQLSAQLIFIAYLSFETKAAHHLRQIAEHWKSSMLQASLVGSLGY
jgi:hypothetical protein